MPQGTIEKLLLIMFGWLLGMLGSLITEAIKKRIENRKVKVALAAELKEVSYQLATQSFLLRIELGALDRPYLQWFKGVISKYSGPQRMPSAHDKIDQLLRASDTELSALANGFRSPATKAVAVSKIIVPLLDARVSSLSYLENRVQILLFDIRSNINHVNDLADQARYYMNLTFGKLEGNNHQTVISNYNSSIQRYAEKAERAVRKIEELDAITGPTKA